MPREGPKFVVIKCVVQYCTNDILVVTSLFSFPLHLYAGPSVLQGGHMDYYYYYGNDVSNRNFKNWFKITSF